MNKNSDSYNVEYSPFFFEALIFRHHYLRLDCTQ